MDSFKAWEKEMFRYRDRHNALMLIITDLLNEPLPPELVERYKKRVRSIDIARASGYHCNKLKQTAQVTGATNESPGE